MICRGWSSLGKLPGVLALLLAALVLVVGCSSSSDGYDTGDANPVVQTYSGPKYLRGTIGSYGEFVNRTPRYVGGYGMVVDLNGTGSNEVPGFVREWLVNEMLRNKLGSVSFGTERFGPERVMADTGSSVVAVEGLIPPGARRGAKFDILVTMIDQTSTSLAGGRLFWPTQMSPLGLDRRLLYTETQAVGYGELFVNPVKPPDAEDTEFQRQAVVVNGGTVIESQVVRFQLNQANVGAVRRIVDRVNARFEAGDGDKRDTAVGKTDTVIEINVPARFADQPNEFLELVEHLYLDPSPGFVRPQAEAMAEALLADPDERAQAVVLAWKGLGPNTVPVLRPYYNHEDPRVRNAALEAGAWLSDRQALEPLERLAEQGGKDDRILAARALVSMSRNERARTAVRDLLNDEDDEVRVAAYQSLAMVDDRVVKRLSVHDGNEHKFYIDRVPSDRPMVYAIQDEEQSIVIFGDDIPLRKNVFAQLGDAISLRTLPTDTIPVGLRERYTGDTAFVPIHRCGPLQMIPSLQPVSDREDGDKPPPDWRVEIGDAEGNTMMLNIRDPELQDTFGVEVLNQPNRGEATDDPRLYAVVRLVRAAGKDAAGNDGPAVGELIDLRPPDTTLPVALRYLPPGKREPKVYRISPTVATLAYTLGFKRDDVNTQFGPDLSFSQVVRALHQLHEQRQLPAPFHARISPLAQRIANAQRNNESAEPRPEITDEELDRLRERDINPPDEDAPEDAPDSLPDTQPDGDPDEPQPPADGEGSTPPGSAVGRGPQE